MADHGSDSDFDDDEFGHDVAPVASAPVIAMKKFHDVVDLIGPLYHCDGMSHKAQICDDRGTSAKHSSRLRHFGKYLGHVPHQFHKDRFSFATISQTSRLTYSSDLRF